MRGKRRAVHGSSLGFTLMEVMLAMAIMGIVGSLGFANYATSLKRSRDAQRKLALDQITKSLESYVLDNSLYPPSCNGKIEGCDGAACEWGGSFSQSNKTYMSTLPNDPVASYTYIYAVSANRKSYQLFARMENLSDPKVNQSGYGVQCNSANEDCNYGISSANTTLSVVLNENSSNCP